MSTRDDIGLHMAAVAEMILGRPNPQLSSKTELRYGTHGSLSVDLTKGTWYDHEAGVGGGVLDLLRDRGGYSNGGAVAFLEANGFSLNAPVSPGGRPLRGSLENPSTPPRDRILATYDYCDESGALLYQVVRFEPKRFVQRRPDPSAPGGWVWSIKGTRLVPYRLPELQAALVEARIVFVVEGEKDVDTLLSIGVPATCNPMGAGKWQPALSGFLAGADVVIVPDNDEPGRLHADMVGRKLDGIASRVRVLDLVKLGYGLLPKGDVSDWLSRGHGVDELYGLAERAPDWRETDPTVSPVSPVSPERLVQSAEEFLSGFKPPDYVLDGILQRGSLYSLTARTGHGKTAVTLYLAQAIARGLAVRGREVQQGSVLILAGENPDDVRARYLVQADKLGFDWRRVPVHFVPGVVNLKERLPQVRAEAQAIADLGFVIVDTAQAYFPGDEPNNNAQMGEYARLLRELTTLAGRPAVIVNCHPVKSAGRDNLVPYGGGAFLNEVDGNLSLWGDGEAQTTLHWQGKFRGPDFEPMTFRMETTTSDSVLDSKGRHLPSVMAQPLGEHELDAGEAARDEDEVRFLVAVGSNKNASFATLARAAGFLNKAGDPLKAKVQRLGHRLKEDRLVEQVRGKFRLTEKGRQEVGLGDNGD